MSPYAKITSTARFIPSIEVPNSELVERFSDPSYETDIGKLEHKTGIKTRWYAPDSWCTSDVALPAAQEALKRADKHPDDIDLIILGTDSPDYITPATSVVLQHKLGAARAGTFDVGCACASFPTGLSIVAAMISANPSIRTVLVVGVYAMHKLADPDDPMIFFYGDGAGAAVVEAAEEPGIFASAFRADGSYHETWGIYAGGTKEPINEAAMAEGRQHVKLVGRFPSSVNNEGWPRLVAQLEENGKFTREEIDFAIFTQVKRSSIEIVMETLGLPLEKTHMVMDKWGYTGSACVPMALDDAVEQHKIHAGDLVVLVGSGVGYNQAAVAMRW